MVALSAAQMGNEMADKMVDVLGAYLVVMLAVVMEQI